jgi:hypothetical protein
MLAGAMSPLINAREAHDVQPSTSPDVDLIPVSPLPAGTPARRLPALRERCAAGDNAGVRELFAEAAWDLLVETVRVASPMAMHRVVHITRPHRGRVSADHRRTDDLFRRFAGLPFMPTGVEAGRPMAVSQ